MPRPASSPAAASAGQRRIVFANRKGGSGKTATAVNVAAGLSRLGHRVLLVDCDPQAHASLSLGWSPFGRHPTLYDLLTDPDLPLAQVLKPSAEAPQHLVILPASSQLAGLEVEGGSAPEWRSRLATLLMASRETAAFDYLLLDVPPTVGLFTIMAMLVAREAVIPVQAHFLALEGLAEMVRFVYQINASVNPDLVISGILPTFYVGSTRLARKVVAELKANFGSGLVMPAIHQNVQLAEAPSFGQSIFRYAPRSAGARDYQAAVSWLATGPGRRPA
ncbi:MAG: ParA family protein [Thermodesulfobacteriota bacterium]